MKNTSISEKENGGAGLWIGVGVVFGLMALAWTAMFFFATQHRPATVPLESASPAGAPVGR
jgi:hypothetical protein